MRHPALVRRAALRLLVGGSVLALAACGRKGAPLAPYDVDPCYPRHYPMSEGDKEVCAQKEIYAREHPPQPPPPKGKRSREKPPAPAAQPPAQGPAQAPAGQTAPTEPPAQPQ